MTELRAWRKLARSDARDDRVAAAARLPSQVAYKTIRRDLLTLLDDDDEVVRAEAADSLGWFSEEDSLRQLKQRVASERSMFVKAFILESLASQGQKSEIPLFYSLHTSRSVYIRLQALGGLALVSLTEAAFELRRGLSNKEKNVDVGILIRRFESSALGAINRLGDAIVDVRRFAGEAALDGERATARSSSDALLSELEQVLQRVKKSEYGSQHSDR